MVRYDAAMTPALRRCHAEALGAEIVDAKVVLPGLQKLLLPRGRSVEGAVAALQRLGRDYVEYALPNSIVEPQAVTDDPLVPDFQVDAGPNNFWWLWSGAKCPQPGQCTYKGIGAVDAWGSYTGNSKFRLGILDSGFETNKGDFEDGVDSNFSGQAAQVYQDEERKSVVKELGTEPGVCKKWKRKPGVARNVCEVGDRTNDHGTAVAWFAAARGNNGIFGSGVMQQAAIVPAQLTDGGIASLVEGMRWLADPKGGNAKVVNISRGWFGSLGDDQLVADVMAQWPNTLWVWAAGNDAYNTDTRYNPNMQGYEPYQPLYCGRYRLTWQGVGGQRDPKPPEMFDCIESLDDQQGGPPTRRVLADDAPCRLRKVFDSWQPKSSTVEELGRWQDADKKTGKLKENGIGGNRGNMICVAANDMDGQLAEFSNYGRKTVEFSAPGTSMTRPMTGSEAGNIGESSGTSYSAPLVAGIAGLVRSKYPSLSAAQTKCVLMNAAAQAPLPPQEIDNVRHPAFLQPQDTVNTPVKQPTTPEGQAKAPKGAGRMVKGPGDRTEGASRLGADELLRVMGIPNAAFALDEAARAALDQPSLTRDCQEARQAIVQLTATGTKTEEDKKDATVAWKLRGIPLLSVAKVEARPDWVWTWNRKNAWVDVTKQVIYDNPDENKLDGRLKFPRGTFKTFGFINKTLRSKQLSLRWTITIGREVTQVYDAISVWLWPDASKYFRDLKNKQKKN